MAYTNIVTNESQPIQITFFAAISLALLGCWLTNAQALTVGFSLFVLLGLVTLLAIRRLRDKALQRSDLVYSLLALLFCSGLVIRAADTVYYLNLLALFLVACVAYIQRFSRHFPMVSVCAWLTAPLRLLGNCLASPLLSVVNLYHTRWFQIDDQVLKHVFIGGLLAAPLVLVFGSLLVESDARFASFIDRLFTLDLAFIGQHSGEFILCWVAAAGLLHLSFIATPNSASPYLAANRLHLNAIQVLVVLSSLTLLFLSYLIVQSTYFFGSHRLVVTTPGMTFSSYAVRGFWELIWVAVGSAMCISGAYWSVRKAPHTLRRGVKWLGLILLGLNAILLASAAHRMSLYVEAYQLSPRRFYASTQLLYVLLLLGVLASRLYRNRLGRFIWDAIRLALGFILLLNVISPNNLVAGYNLRERALSATSDPMLFTLGKDVVPYLIAHTVSDPKEACAVKQRLASQLGYRPNWRNWTWADRRARQALDNWQIRHCNRAPNWR